MKRIALFAAVMLIITGCGSDDPSPAPVVEGFTVDNYPKVEGSTSTRPLNILTACKLLGVGYKWEKNTYVGTWEIEPVFNSGNGNIAANFWNLFRSSQTHQSFINLIDKKAGIILTARKIAADEKAYADGLGVTLIEAPIARDAFVFILHPDNPVESLTIEQIQRIYMGEITNWSEVGGNNAEIVPYVRDEYSGSQDLMETMVMKDLDIMDFRYRASHEIAVAFTMSGAFEAVIREVNAICYTVFYYKETMLKDAATKSIAINGVFPSRENISNNTYPLVSDVYATIRSDLDTSSTAYRLYELYQTETGREIISESGYLLK